MAEHALSEADRRWPLEPARVAREQNILAVVDDVLNLADHERQQLANADYYSVFMNAVSDAEVRTTASAGAQTGAVRKLTLPNPRHDTTEDLAAARPPR